MERNHCRSDGLCYWRPVGALGTIGVATAEFVSRRSQIPGNSTSFPGRPSDFGSTSLYQPPRPLHHSVALHPPFRGLPQSLPDEYRSWRFARMLAPQDYEKFTVLSYNILADYLARDHRHNLYFHIPPHIMDWEWRKQKLLLEFSWWAPDIMCLQEVDRFHDLEKDLALRGYNGVWKMRTGDAKDGCAIFWRTSRFQLRYEEHIEFSNFGLRDNVCQICVLQSRIPKLDEYASKSSPTRPNISNGANSVIICNVHVLYNPKRGDIKLGQVRVLLNRAYAISREWNDAPVIVCGDFNSTPKSPLYNYISEKKLSLLGLSRNEVSGQHSGTIYCPPPYNGSGSQRSSYIPSYTSSSPIVGSGRSLYDPCLWSPVEIEAASGNPDSTFVEHNLKLKSAYTDVEDYAGTKDMHREPEVTSYNRSFMGTVDYIWYSEGLQTIKVLDTIPKRVLQKTSGFPTKKWGSDHLSLVCEMGFIKKSTEKS